MGTPISATIAFDPLAEKYAATADSLAVMLTLFVHSWRLLTDEQRTWVLINADRTLALNAEQIAQDNTE